jgi:hypothetical protein
MFELLDKGKIVNLVKNLRIPTPTNPGLQKLTHNIITKSIGHAVKSAGAFAISHPFITLGVGLTLSVGLNALYKYFDDSNLNLIILTPMMKGGLPYVYGVKGYELGSFSMHLSGKYTKSLNVIKENFSIIGQVYEARGLTTTALATLALLFED